MADGVEPIPGLIETEADLPVVRDRAVKVVEVWFDGQMDRISQKFSNSTRVVTVVISFIVFPSLLLSEYRGVMPSGVRTGRSRPQAMRTRAKFRGASFRPTFSRAARRRCR